jgi:hypothetical protein
MKITMVAIDIPTALGCSMYNLLSLQPWRMPWLIAAFSGHWADCEEVEVKTF